MSIVFPCPNCGANQSVHEDETSTQCQFCGNTISVPENLRPKNAPPAAMAPAAFPGMPSPQPFSPGSPVNIPGLGGTVGVPGLGGLPGMFMNMDLNKLRAMAMAARNGDKAEAARLYQENFGVSPEIAMQAAEMMSEHHPVVLNQMFGTPTMMQANSQPMSTPVSSPSTIYTLPSPSGGNPRAGNGSRWAACVVGVVVLLIGMGLAAAILFAAFAQTR